jgi:hypothetical protein
MALSPADEKFGCSRGAVWFVRCDMTSWAGTEAPMCGRSGRLTQVGRSRDCSTSGAQLSDIGVEPPKMCV